MKKLITVIAIGTLAACASNGAKYEMASDDSDYGYYESKITDNRYRVSYNGKTSATRDEVKDMALLRAAELTLLNDHDWFRVMDRDTEQSSRDGNARVTTGLGAGRDVYRSCGLLGCTTTVSPAYAGIEITSRPGRDMYTTSIEIAMGDGEVDDETSVYNASELYGYLNDQY